MKDKKLICKNIKPTKAKQFYLYFLFDNNNIVYIGETNNLNQRISSHRGIKKYWLSSVNAQAVKKWTHYKFIISSCSQQTKRWEKRLIKFYNPKYNIGHNKKALYHTILKKKKYKGLICYYYEYVKKNNLYYNNKFVPKLIKAMTLNNINNNFANYRCTYNLTNNYY